MSEKNYYDILNIDKNCSEDDIKKAYRRKSMETHPKNGSKIRRTQWKQMRVPEKV